MAYSITLLVTVWYFQLALRPRLRFKLSDKNIFILIFFVPLIYTLQPASDMVMMASVWIDKSLAVQLYLSFSFILMEIMLSG